MDAALNFLLRQIMEEMKKTNKVLERIAIALENKNANETVKVCEDKNETTV